MPVITVDRVVKKKKIIRKNGGHKGSLTPKNIWMDPDQGCQMVCFQTKKSKFG
jgi:hypothetical protein